MQLRSCSMRSAVQVALEEAMLFGAGASGAGSRAVDVIGGIAGDERGSDGAIDGDMERPRSIAAAVWAADRAFVRAQRATARPKTSKRKSVCGFKSRSGKEMPQTRPKAFSSPWAAGPPKKSAPPSTNAAFHRAASRLKDGKPAVGVAPVRRTDRGRFLSLLSENPRRIEASHDSTRLPRVKMPL
jgi:hypothetical protein